MFYLHDYLRCVLQRILVRANEPLRFHTFYFLFFLFQETEDSLAYKFAGGKEDGVDTAKDVQSWRLAERGRE